MGQVEACGRRRERGLGEVGHPAAGGAQRAPALILRSPLKAGVSKDGRGQGAKWFETRGTAALLTMRVLARVRASSETCR